MCCCCCLFVELTRYTLLISISSIVVYSLQFHYNLNDCLTEKQCNIFPCVNIIFMILTVFIISTTHSDNRKLEACACLSSFLFSWTLFIHFFKDFKLVFNGI